MQLLESYSQIISNGVFMRTTLNKLEHLGKSVQDRLQEDKQKNYLLLGFLHRSPKKLRELMKPLKGQKIALLRDIGDENPMVSDNPRVKLIMVNMEEHKKCLALMEASNSLFEDLIGYRAH